MTGGTHLQRRAKVQAALSRARRNGQQARGPCPFCEEERGHDRFHNLAIDLRKQVYYCHRCRAGGSLSEVPLLGPEEETAPACIFPPEGYTPLWETGTLQSISFLPAVKYATERKITRELARKALVGATLDGFFAHRLIIPVLAPGGVEWLGYIARDWTGRAEKPYRYPKGMSRGGILYHPDALAAETDVPALCVESFMDAAPYWDDAVAFLGKPSHKQVPMLFTSKRPLCVALDGDAWRESEALAMRLQFEGCHAGFVRLPEKTDPGECDPAWLREEAQRSIVWHPSRPRRST